MTAATTLGAALHDAAMRLRHAGTDDADLEADVLLRHALGMDDDRAHLIARLREPLDDAAAARFEALLRRRVAHEPAAYIVGFREFYGLKFACTPDALIPRPETELLVENALEWLGRADAPPRPLVVDVGTGNGAIAVTLAVHCAGARILAIDTSAPALRLARRNAAEHGVIARVALARGELLAPLREPADVIVANLPYVTEDDWPALAPEIRRYEPRDALVGGRTGTELIERLVAAAPGRMRPHALLLCECGDRQGEALRAAAARAFPRARIEVRRDLAARDRVLRIEQ